MRHDAIGLVLVVAGLAAVNFVYLYDLIVDQHDGWIFVGLKAAVGIALGCLAVLAGAVLLWRAGRGGGERGE